MMFKLQKKLPIIHGRDKMDYIGVIQFDRDHGLAQLIRELGYLSRVVTYPVSKETMTDPFLKGVIVIGENKEKEDFVKTVSLPLLDCKNEVNKEEITTFLCEEVVISPNWDMDTYGKETIALLKEELANKQIFCALSGGVDSTVCAVMLHEAVGDNLHCIFVDTGLMRHKETEEVTHMFTEVLHLPMVVIDAKKQFLTKLQGVINPEEKRKIIGNEFIRVFEEEAKNTPNPNDMPTVLVQGTIYPDVIESGVGAHLVKSHHNVGGLPKDIAFDEIVEPVRLLFKSEVRALGHHLGIPKSFIKRQPFPGPGLAIRVLGEVTEERLELSRQVNYILETEIKKEKLDIWQYFAVLTDVFSVGMVDGKRTYGNTIAIRAVSSSDAMQANFYPIPYDVLERISNRITTQMPSITRVVYDITPKPPATIEWE